MLSSFSPGERSLIRTEPPSRSPSLFLTGENCGWIGWAHVVRARLVGRLLYRFPGSARPASFQAVGWRWAFRHDVGNRAEAGTRFACEPPYKSDLKTRPVHGEIKELHATHHEQHPLPLLPRINHRSANRWTENVIPPKASHTTQNTRSPIAKAARHGPRSARRHPHRNEMNGGAVVAFCSKLSFP